jgi:hypothetical protein
MPLRTALASPASVAVSATWALTFCTARPCGVSPAFSGSKVSKSTPEIPKALETWVCAWATLRPWLLTMVCTKVVTGLITAAP